MSQCGQGGPGRWQTGQAQGTACLVEECGTTETGLAQLVGVIRLILGRADWPMVTRLKQEEFTCTAYLGQTVASL